MIISDKFDLSAVEKIIWINGAFSTDEIVEHMRGINPSLAEEIAENPQLIEWMRFANAQKWFDRPRNFSTFFVKTDFHFPPFSSGIIRADTCEEAQTRVYPPKEFRVWEFSDFGEYDTEFGPEYLPYWQFWDVSLIEMEDELTRQKRYWDRVVRDWYENQTDYPIVGDDVFLQINSSAVAVVSASQTVSDVAAADPTSSSEVSEVSPCCADCTGLGGHPAGEGLNGETSLADANGSPMPFASARGESTAPLHEDENLGDLGDFDA